MATLQTGSLANVNACSDNKLVNVGNHKNEARFTFSQIYQYLYMVLIQVTFKSLTNRLCERDLLSSSRVLLVIFIMLEEVS